MSERFSAEYIELCRKLALPREWRYGDWWAYDDEGPARDMCRWDEYDDDIGFPEGEATWLPLEGDWLDLLEAEGVDLVEIGHAGDGRALTGYSMKATDTERGREWVSGFQSDRLLALGRLYEPLRESR